MKKQSNIDMARYLAGEMNPGEEISFRKVIQQSTQKDELELMEKGWKQFNDYVPGENQGPDKAWNRLFARLAGDGLIEGQVRTRRAIPLGTLRIAAAILVLVALAIPTIYLGVFRDQNGNPTAEFESDTGVSSVDLPDGSRVYLNKGGKISYPEGFTGGRNVDLDGEAYFEVMSDPTDPFIVRSGNVVISVLGTAFNVKKPSGKSGVEVFVESGKVKVSLENSDDFLLLDPGEICMESNGSLSSRPQNEANYLSWKTKDFVFVNENLDLVLRDLENAYHVSISAGDVMSEDLRITSTYSEQSIDAILQTIGTAFGFSVSKKEDQYYLSK